MAFHLARLVRPAVVFLLLAQPGWPADLAYSTYLRKGFAPAAIASDAQGNLYLAGGVVSGTASSGAGFLVMKLDSTATALSYSNLLDAGGQDTVGGICVDPAGSLYVAGSTSNPNFAATSTELGTAPGGAADRRSFLMKLGPRGNILFSVLLGGAASSRAQAVAVTPQGKILITGISDSSGFPVTAGAYSVSDSKGKPFLMELDAAAATLIFSATGIGGSSVALDGSGNIFVSGSTAARDYPTTPGAYQHAFGSAFVCSFPPCQTITPAFQQYLTKVESTGARLIYSTGVNDATPNRSGDTINTGLAVDAAGNAYITGMAGGPYPFTKPREGSAKLSAGFLTKLDPEGKSILYSIPVGGAGVQIDSTGAVYAGGVANGSSLPGVLGWLPTVCRPGAAIGATSAAYVAKLDPAGGLVLDAQWIDSSALGLTGLTLAAGKVWTAGVAQRADVPFTPGSLFPADLTPGQLPGAYLGAIDFSQPPAAGPPIGCVLDAADFMHTGLAAPNQILSVFGQNLGPSQGVVSTGGSATSLGGVTVTFDGNPAPLLYVSSSQVNVVVPTTAAGQKTSATMQIVVDGRIAPGKRALPLAPANLNAFINTSAVLPACPDLPGLVANTIQLLARNADGTGNSCTNPAAMGSTVSFFLEGSGAGELNLAVQFGSGPAEVVRAARETPFVWKADVQLPSSLSPSGITILGGHKAITVLLTSANQPVGPFATGGPPLAAALWVK